MNLQRRLGPMEAVLALGIGQGAAADLRDLALIHRCLLRFARQGGAVPAAITSVVIVVVSLFTKPRTEAQVSALTVYKLDK